MKEEFVTFELAKKLREKGFQCKYPFAMYNEHGEFLPMFTSADYYKNETNPNRFRLYYEYDDYNDLDEYAFIAPTIEQALKWLREEKDIHISTMPYIDKDYELKWLYNVIIIKVSDVCTFTEKQGRDFTSSDEAALAGIEYTLYHLI